MGKLYNAHYLYNLIFIFEGRILMNKNDLEKSEKNSNTIEITIPSNGIISESKKDSQSQNTDMSNMNSNANDDNSKKGQMSNQSDSSDASDDTTSKKEQIIINISHQ
jgi:hypothetical protein